MNVLLSVMPDWKSVLRQSPDKQLQRTVLRRRARGAKGHEYANVA